MAISAFALLAGIISIALVVVGIMRRHVAGARPFVVISSGCALWSIGASVELLSTQPIAIYFWDNLQFSGVNFCAAGALLFALEYAGSGRSNSRAWRPLAAVVPLIDLALVWTDSAHGLVRQNAHIIQLDGAAHLVYDYGVWMWFSIAYNYLLSLAALALLIRRAFTLEGLLRKQIIAFIISILVPILGGILTITGNVPFAIERLDITPFTFTVANIGFAIAAFRYRLISIAPVARDIVFDFISEGVIVVDNQGVVVDINVVARQIPGLDELSPGMIAAERAPQLFSRSSVMKANFPGRSARYYEIKSSRVQIGRSGASGSILTLRDVTDRILWERELELARLELIEANQIKSQFIANINHEIRTPMNAILGVAQLLEETPLSEEQRRMVTLFRNAGGVLLSMMNDLLEYSRNESGGVKAERSAFLLREKTTEAWRPVETLGAERGLAMRLDWDPDLPEAVLGDSARLTQVLRILLSNAIKFTEQGGVTLRVRRPRPAEFPDRVEFAVEDTGIGMSQAITARLFKPFNQAEDSLRRRFGGAGLGLAIANQLASLLGAEVRVTSAPGAGSEFNLTLSLPEAPGGMLVSLSGRSERSLAGKRILAVDDASDNLFLIDRFLRDSGVQLALCQSPREALELFQRSLYDIALVDIQMPEVDGYELIEKLRAIERGRAANPPAAIIALTAFALPEDRARALESGFDEHLSKPIRKDQLLDAMYQAWLRKSRADHPS